MNQTRQQLQTVYTVTTKDVADPLSILRQSATSGRYKFLLAHADDGVIWGRVEDGQLSLSSDAFKEVSPPLRALTLQQARLFGPAGEVFVWRTDDGWHMREIVEGTGEAGTAFDEAVMLWGTNADTQTERDGFWLAVEGDLGIQHTPPVKLGQRHALRLQMRHYVAYDEFGAASVKLSRLVDVTNGGKA